MITFHWKESFLHVVLEKNVPKMGTLFYFIILFGYLFCYLYILIFSIHTEKFLIFVLASLFGT